MSDWDALLARLAETPRENGTAALHRAATFLHDELAGAGVDTSFEPFTAAPFALRLAGVAALAGGVLYWRLARSGRGLAALAVALALPALLLAELEGQRPLLGRVGAQTQHNLVARLPAQGAEQRLVFAAHYDTKTDLLDHVERAPVDLLALPVVLLMLAGGLAGLLAPRRRVPRGLVAVAAWAALAYGVLVFAALSAGALLPRRSPGALDDGASCALLVRLAQQLAAAGPLSRTEVEFWWLSAEEVGMQGSRTLAARRFADPPELPTFVVNLEGLGASARHAALPSERAGFRRYRPDPELLALLDRVHRVRFDAPLEMLRFGAATDARSFLARGIPAVTLTGSTEAAGFPRGLHSARDERSRLDEAALDESLAYLLELTRAADAGGLEPR